MVFKIKKLFLKIVSSFKLILISILFILILFLFSESAFSNITYNESNLALKYCDSIEKNLFKGLENEKKLKYEYFFNSINTKSINDEKENLINLVERIETICSYELSREEKEDIRQMLKYFLSTE